MNRSKDEFLTTRLNKVLKVRMKRIISGNWTQERAKEVIDSVIGTSSQDVRVIEQNSDYTVVQSRAGGMSVGCHAKVGLNGEGVEFLPLRADWATCEKGILLMENSFTIHVESCILKGSRRDFLIWRAVLNMSPDIRIEKYSQTRGAAVSAAMSDYCRVKRA